MALIKSEKFEKIEKGSNRVHKVVDATYSTFIANGERYYQIDTYGSDDRKIRGKVSQSIQLSEETLRSILAKMGINNGK